MYLICQWTNAEGKYVYKNDLKEIGNIEIKTVIELKYSNWCLQL